MFTQYEYFLSPVSRKNKLRKLREKRLDVSSVSKVTRGVEQLVVNLTVVLNFHMDASFLGRLAESYS